MGGIFCLNTERTEGVAEFIEASKAVPEPVEGRSRVRRMVPEREAAESGP
jgi:hypothetical protein